MEKENLYGYFKLQITDIIHEKTRTKVLLRRKALLIAAQNNAIRNTYIKNKIDNTQNNSKCWLCGDRDKTVDYIITKYSKPAQREYNKKVSK